MLGFATKGPRSIGRALCVTAVVLAVAVIGLTSYAAILSRERTLADAERELARLDMVFAEQTGLAVETVDVILQGFAQRLADTGRPSTDATALIEQQMQQRIAGLPQLARIAVLDPEGRVMLSTPATDHRPFALPSLARAAFSIAAASVNATAPLVSSPFRDSSGAWVSLLMRPIRDSSGHLIGVVVGCLRLSYFEDFYRGVELGAGSAIMLHRRDGMLLARFPHVDDRIGGSFADLPPFTKVLANAMAGTVEVDSPIDGRRRIVAIRALPNLPFAVNVAVDKAQVLNDWYRQTTLLISDATAAAALVFALLLLLARASARRDALLARVKTAKDAAETANASLLIEMEERLRAEDSLRQAQRIEAIGQITSGVAHDFNNLLTVLLGNIELLQEILEPTPAAAARLGIMRAAAERGATLTGQLLAFSRRQPLLPRPVALDRLVPGMLDLLRSATGGTILIATRLASNVWPAMVDQTQIELAILNLAINARDAMPNGGTLTIEVRNHHISAPRGADHLAAGEYVMVRVADTGTGMTAEVRAKAFEPFFTTKGPGEGSGLGLSQVFGFVRQSGGDVTIDSTPGEGTIVTLLLPRSARQPADLAPEPMAFSIERHRAAILLVDDDPPVRATTRLVLQAMGYSVTALDSGKAALDMMAQGHHFDLLLTDVAMPGMNGLELARRVRHMQPDLPIMIISGYTDLEPAYRDVCQRIVKKPYRAAELAAEIEAVLQLQNAPA
jgi:signal transduction histidine kinase/CheY-like chemotaxis protein